MNTHYCQLALRRLMPIVALFCASGNVSLASGQGSSPSGNPSPQLYRELETSLKVEPESTVVEFVITNRSKDPRYVLVPLDLNPYRMRLTTRGGAPIAMKPKGRRVLTEPAAGSVRVVALRKDVPWTYKIDLAELFELPGGEDVFCDVSRHVRFNDPDIKPGDAEWVSFPPVTIRVGSPNVQKTTESAPKPQEVAPKADPKPAEPQKSPEIKPQTTTPSEEPASPIPWSIIVVLIVAASGLLWLLLKRRS